MGRSQFDQCEMSAGEHRIRREAQRYRGHLSGPCQYHSLHKSEETTGGFCEDKRCCMAKF